MWRATIGRTVTAALAALALASCGPKKGSGMSSESNDANVPVPSRQTAKHVNARFTDGTTELVLREDGTGELRFADARQPFTYEIDHLTVHVKLGEVSETWMLQVSRYKLTGIELRGVVLPSV